MNNENTNPLVQESNDKEYQWIWEIEGLAYKERLFLLRLVHEGCRIHLVKWFSLSDLDVVAKRARIFDFKPDNRGKIGYSIVQNLREKGYIAVERIGGRVGITLGKPARPLHYEQLGLAPSQPGYVYAIENSRKFIKIGWTRDPAKRILELQTGESGELNVIGSRYVPNAPGYERALHVRYEEQRRKGEWFQLMGVKRYEIELALNSPDIKKSRPVRIGS